MAHVIASRVSETSTSTGTGDFTLGGAATAHKTLASRCSVGDTVDYVIEAVDANGSPSGDWEAGIGTYSAANTLTRTTVKESSNSDALVSFAAGNKKVFIAPSATRATWAREKLTSSRTYYVRTDGSDSNNGLANTSGGAFLTIQKAIDVIADTLDINRQTVTVQLADGTYTSGATMRSLVGSNLITIQGNNSTPSNVVVSTTSSNCFTSSIPGATLYVKDMKLQTTTSGICVQATNGGFVSVNNIDFGAAATSHMYSTVTGSTVQVVGNYTISGNSPVHVIVLIGAVFLCDGRTVTISGTRNFSTAYLYMRGSSSATISGNTFSGSATGKRYDLTLNASCYSAGATLPGDVAGTTATGGEYA